MWRLLSYLKSYWKIVLLAPSFMLIEVVMDLVQPILMASIVDKGISSGEVGFIFRTGLLMIGVALIGLAGGIGSTIASSYASQGFGADLRLDAFKKVQSFTFTNLDNFPTASLITRLTNDVTQVQHTMMMLLRAFVRAPLLAFGGLVMAISINRRLALIFAVTIPLLSLALWMVISKGFPLFAKVQKRLDRVNGVMRENLAGVRVVKAFVRAEREKVRFGVANDELMDITIKANRIVSLLMPLMMVIMNLSIVAIIWFGGIQVNQGSMSVGQVMAFINYVTQILFALMLVAFVLMAISRAKASADRINEILKTDTDIHDIPKAVTKPVTKGQVVFENVFFQYRGAGGAPVLQDISFRVEAGETIGILGSTGSGKTSLVSLIPRLYDVTNGRVLVDGIDVRDYELETLRKGIGMVLQETILFSGTIQENIRWGNEKVSEEELIEAAKLAQAHDFIMSLPDGYDTKLGQRGINLSGGQKQRLAIARALLRKPSILILDDSTSAVDIGTEARLRKALAQLPEQCTRFIIAQRISTVMEADKIIVLEDGRIETIGTHEELLKNSRVYQDIYHSQLGEGVILYG